MTVQSVLDNARHRLGDVDKTGWSDDRLLYLANTAQADFCRLTGILKKKTYIGLANYKSMYPLPTDMYQVTRLEYLGERLPILSREDADQMLTLPERYAIKSNLRMEAIEIQPPFDDLVDQGTFVSGDVADSFALDYATPLGVAASIGGDLADGYINTTLTLDTVLGVTVGIASIPEDSDISYRYGDISGWSAQPNLLLEADSLGVLVETTVEDTPADQLGFLTSVGYIEVDGFGICTDAFVTENFFTLYYIALPPKIWSISGSFVIDDAWEMAMVHYIVGMARQDDNDEGNYQLGELELGKYYMNVENARKASSRSFNSQVAEDRHTIYRRF